MDVFMKILGLLIALGFIFVGIRFLFQSKSIIQGIQKFKFKETATPRKQELLFSRIIGVLLLLIGIYYTIVVILSFLG